MKQFLSVGIALIAASCSQLAPVGNNSFDPSRSTVKIQAVTTNGTQNLGSGVVIAPDTIATNCHVMRASNRAFVIQPERLYPVLEQAAMPDLDVCILKTKALGLPATQIATDAPPHIGDDIVLSGYPFGLGLRMKRGKITGLYLHEQDRIIEINAGFNHGASGGGVFDRNGNLIGLMTFMGPEAGAFHFYAIPAAWLTQALELEFAPLKPFKTRSFWEKGDFVKQFAE